jgi:D-serine deaminase-like pyridoxal phosphate-dependent protein
VANQLIGLQKLARFVQLSRRATVRACVDSLDNARQMSAEAIRQGARVGVLAEIKIAPKRWGLPPGDEAVAFVRQIAALPGLRFDGLQAYYGGLAHLHDAAERDKCALRSMELAVETRRRIEAAGIACPILSGAGTGTFWAVLDLPGVTELQLGSYVLMDWDFRTRTGDRFQIALSVLATVISASGDEFVLDVGVKGLGNKLGPPRLFGQQGYEVLQHAAEEHTVVRSPGHRLKVGDRLRLLPSHAGCTAHLYRQFVVHEGDSVRDLWPISATGYDLTTAEAP